MGMFDNVHSEVALPDGFVGELQTKDFDCEMSVVAIRADGRLEIERFEYEAVPKAERPYPDGVGIMALAGSVRRINNRWEPIAFHGVMNFYGSEGRHGTPEYRWHEYQAKFTDGKLVEIVAIPEAPSPIASQETAQ